MPLTPSKPKVLLLLHDLTLTGAPKVALDAFEEIGDRVALRIVAPEGGALEERCRRIARLQLVRVSSRRRPLLRPGRRLMARWIGLSAWAWRPDVIYANSLGVLHLARRLGLPQVPVLLHVHELQLSFDLLLGDEKALLQWPARFIAVSEPVRHLLTTRYGIDPRRVRLVHEFVRTEDFQSPAPAGDRDEETFVVGGAGAPQWRKGTTLWLQTAAALRPLMGSRRFRFVWVGLRDDYDSICFREEARKQGVDDLVEWVPATREPLPHYARSDVFAMTSWEDPCPVVVLEHMMLGKPVLCFAAGGGAPEVVGSAGVVIADFSPSAMARAIADLAGDPARRRALGEAARERVGRDFTASTQAPKLLHEIMALTRKNGASR